MRVGAAAIRVQRLQQEPALLRIARHHEPVDDVKCALRLRIVPLGTPAGRQGSETHLATTMTVAAPDLSLARVLERALDTRPEECEVELGLRCQGVAIGRKAADPLEHGLVLGILTGFPERAARVLET